MSQFDNRPKFDTNDKIIYSHQPLTFDHFGIRATIKENGHVVIASGANSEGEYDEVEVPASLIFKLAMSLKLTRTIKHVSSEDKK
jgi:hypothetical protein